MKIGFEIMEVDSILELTNHVIKEPPIASVSLDCKQF
jgi:hypothetical protein